MEKKQKNYPLGEEARKLLLLALPMIILQLLAFVAFLLPLEGGELLKNEAIVLALFDAVGRGLVFTGIGVILLDYMEKKDKQRQ